MSGRYYIPKEKQREMIAQYAAGEDTALIAEQYGVHVAYVRSIASRAGVRKGLGWQKPKPTPKPIKRHFGPHLDAYKATRRGVHIPREREPKYIEYLKSGMSCEEAARKTVRARNVAT